MEYLTARVGPFRSTAGQDLSDAAYRCQMDHCEARIADNVGIFLCHRHLQKAWAAYQIIMGADVPDEKLDEVTNIHALDTPGVVYVVRVGEFIKIGWTRNVRQRMSNLKADAMLHFQPGSRRDEFKLHAKFIDHLAKGREWFDCNEETLKLVEDLRVGRLAA